ncbi:glutathione synthase [Litoribrevibacter euphylliae]|uniref:glutathione synthase n=1 Tax=Litoribrevibacter euphylliae TaxID=1834034 RepID=A0ABV7HKR5_9GAMM
MTNFQNARIPQQVIEDICEWTIMHGVAFRQTDNSARHCPFSIAPVAIEKMTFDHLKKVTPVITQLISNISEDHDFLQASLSAVAKSDPFFGRLMELHQQVHGVAENRIPSIRKPLLIMRTDFMDDRRQGAKIIEFNGIAAGMAPFGQRATELHRYIQDQWPEIYQHLLENKASVPSENQGLRQLAIGIATAARKVREDFKEPGKPIFLMVVQKNEDNVYDQHILESELRTIGITTVRRTFDELSTQLSTGENSRLILKGVGGVDVVYLRAGYQYSDYWAPELDDLICCQTLSQTRMFIEQHHVAMNATISQQLATSKTMQMLLTIMPPEQFERWGLDLDEAQLVKSVLADMKPINADTIHWFDEEAVKEEWVLKNQGEGGGHCIFGEDITEKLKQLSPDEYGAWALMERLYPHEREIPTIAVRESHQTQIDDLVSEIGLFTVFYLGQPVTEFDGYAGYLIRSKPASENEGGIHSGKGILDSLVLVDSL